jgi:hypothetical protein
MRFQPIVESCELRVCADGDMTSDGLGLMPPVLVDPTTIPGTAGAALSNVGQIIVIMWQGDGDGSLPGVAPPPPGAVQGPTAPDPGDFIIQ